MLLFKTPLKLLGDYGNAEMSVLEWGCGKRRCFMKNAQCPGTYVNQSYPVRPHLPYMGKGLVR